MVVNFSFTFHLYDHKKTNSNGVKRKVENTQRVMNGRNIAAEDRRVGTLHYGTYCVHYTKEPKSTLIDVKLKVAIVTFFVHNYLKIFKDFSTISFLAIESSTSDARFKVHEPIKTK